MISLGIDVRNGAPIAHVDQTTEVGSCLVRPVSGLQGVKPAYRCEGSVGIAPTSRLTHAETSAPEQRSTVRDYRITVK